MICESCSLHHSISCLGLIFLYINIVAYLFSSLACVHCLRQSHSLRLRFKHWQCSAVYDWCGAERAGRCGLHFALRYWLPIYRIPTNYVTTTHLLFILDFCRGSRWWSTCTTTKVLSRTCSARRCFATGRSCISWTRTACCGRGTLPTKPTATHCSLSYRARALCSLSYRARVLSMPRSLARSSSVAARIWELLRLNSSPDEFPALYIVFRRELPADLLSVTAAPIRPAHLSRIAVYETSGNRLTADELASDLEEPYNSCTNPTRTGGLELSLLVFCSLVLRTLSTGYIKNTFHRIKYFPL